MAPPVPVRSPGEDPAADQRTLRASLEHLAAIVDASPDAIISEDLAGMVLTWNKGAETLYGFTAEEMVGTSITRLIPEVRRDEERTILAHIARGEHVRHYETERLHKDGTAIPVSLSLAPLYDAAGRVVGASKIARDISERQAAQASRERLAAIVDASPDAIISEDLSGTVLTWNKGAEDMYGFTAEEMIGASITRLIPDDRRSEEQVILERIARGEHVHHYETERIRKDGSVVPVSLSLAPLHDAEGRVVGASKIARDISERHRAEEERLRAQQAIAQAVERLQQAAEIAALGIWEFDLGTQLATFDERGAGIFGLRGRRILPNAEFMAAVDPRDRDLVVAATKAALDPAGDGAYEVEYRITGIDDRQPRWLRAAGRVRFQDGRPVDFLGTVLDTTRLKQAEEMVRGDEERFHLLADSMAQLAWIADENGAVTWLNKRWVEFTGLPAEQLLDERVRHAMHHPDHKDRVAALVRDHLERREAWEFVFPYLRHDGEYRWFLSRAVPVKNEEGHVLRWFGTNTDITEQKIAEDALHENDRRKDEFLAVLAHELRNPLAPLHSGLQLLSDDDSGDPQRAGTLAIMHRQMDHLVRLVDDLMDLSRINQGRIDLRKQPLDLRDAAQHALEAAGLLIQRQRQQLSVELSGTPVPVEGDITRLSQVIANLLNNAAKYTPAGGHIHLKVSADERHAFVIVSDDGIGIEREMLGKVFDMFTQVAPGHGHATSGLGIGLNIVKRLVYLHGGTIDARSDGPGTGSTFTIRLPLRAQAAPLPANDPPRPMAQRTRRILVVDDNEDIVMTTRLLLTRLGHEVRVAYNGKQAITEAEAFRPEVVLMDVGLPVMDGYEAARALRQQPWCKDVKLIAITGWGQARDIERARDAGFDHHVVKPVERKQLEALIAE